MTDASDNRAPAPVPPVAPGAPPRWHGWVREILVTVAIGAVVLFVVKGLQHERQRGGGGVMPVQSEAPPLALEHLDGTPIAATELRDKPMVLVFWATWCGVCQSEMPDLEAFAAAADGRYRVVAVSHEDGPVLRRWAAKRAPSALLVARDPGGRASAAYRVESLPTHVIIDRQGRVVHDFSGAADPEILAEHMRRL